MTLTIELTPELEARLKRRAQAQGVPAEEALLKLVEAIPEDTETPRRMSGAEALAYWKENDLLGLFQEGPEDSVELAQQLRRQAETRDWSEN